MFDFSTYTVQGLQKGGDKIIETIYKTKKYKVKILFILLFIVMLCVMAEKVLNSSFTVPFLSNITHHVASEDNGWNLILVNRDNYIPADYEVQLTELSNGEKVDSRIYPELQEMFNAARVQGYGLKLAEQWVAIPGTSEHQLGIAVDINADTTKKFK